MKPITNVVGFDDAPFPHAHRGDVRVVGAVCCRTRLDGVLSGKVRRDGANSTDVLIELVRGGKFKGHVRAVLLQGIALAGFNVVDVHRLHATLGVPVVVAVRRNPRLQMVKDALLDRTPGGARKWKLVQDPGPLNQPEPLRLAHLIAGGVTTGQSRGRA